eukprot:SAG22_NODE_5115_length_1082_cov_620.009156_1_plen_310_part_10
MAMDEQDLEYPESWRLNGGPLPSWWTRFHKRYTHLSLGTPNTLCQARTNASTPAAINGWFDIVETGKSPTQPDGKDPEWDGFHPEGYFKYLMKNMKQPFLTSLLACSLREIENGDKNEVIKNVAKELAFSPARQACGDQKGFAAGGQQIKMYATKGGHRYSICNPDGQWVTITLVTSADGRKLFSGLTMKGSMKINPADAAAALDGMDHTKLSESASGYSNSKINLQLWEKFKEHQPDTHPGVFPLNLWMDNWSGQITPEFKKWGLENGVIQIMFRSHSTHWVSAQPAPLEYAPLPCSGIASQPVSLLE